MVASSVFILSRIDDPSSLGVGRPRRGRSADALRCLLCTVKRLRLRSGKLGQGGEREVATACPPGSALARSGGTGSGGGSVRCPRKGVVETRRRADLPADRQVDNISIAHRSSHRPPTASQPPVGLIQQIRCCIQKGFPSPV
jgi:hypothetical protein